MPTVRLIDAEQAPLLAQPYYAGGNDPGPIVGALAQTPELLEATMPFVSAALAPAALSFREKELIIVRTSAVLECSYCVATHTAVALDAELSHQEIRALRGEADVADAFTELRELALLRWVDALAGSGGAVADEVTKELRAHWDDHEIVEATVCAGATMMLNRLATGLRLPVAEDTTRRLAREGL